MSAIRDAATVLIVRDGERGLEVFLVKRHGASGFMGGAHVFPGGKVDASDAALEPRARAVDLERTLAALPRTPGQDRSRARTLGLYVAAAREVFEEAGLLLASRADGAALEARAWTKDERADFAGLIARHELVLDLDRLVPFAHWITPSAETKRFDTHFFITRAPDRQDAAIDEHEATEGAWMRPADARARHEAGEIALPPPTLVCLDELSELSSAESAIEAARRRRILAVMPKLGGIEERIAIVMPWDPAFAAMEGESLPIAGPHPMASRISRVVFDGERWRPGAAP